MSTRLRLYPNAIVMVYTLADYLTGETEHCDYIVYTDSAALQHLEAGGQGDGGKGRKRSRKELSGIDADGDQMQQPGPADERDEGGVGADELLVGGGKYVCKGLRDRNTMLKVPLRDFSAVVEIVKNCEKERHKQPQKQGQPHQNQQQHRSSHQQSQSSKVARPLPVKSSNRLDRDNASNQLSHLQDSSLKNMNFNPYGYKSNATNNDPTPKKIEQPPQTPVQSSHRSNNKSSSRHSHSHSHSRSSKHVKRHPIILVPSGYSAVVNLYNIKQFLEEGVFISVEECQKAGMKKPKMEIVKKSNKSGKVVTFHVKDKAPDKSDTSAWDQVVAVVAQGVKWQFKEWPQRGADNGDLLDVFNSVCGYMFRYIDDVPTEFERSWSITLLEVHKQSRHHDKMIQQRFWDELDKFLETKKPHLIR
eukprot:TRINITY_DN37982_c0_g3_i7.p1 TRINITY_DN37982_c0_g3~~TRINITY_DN37982_c0_g3_i7.p1  ORF type:complete len:418 (-),score=34.97 TRINITY_DN37982_c0_g3_i7:438-1691(-)